VHRWNLDAVQANVFAWGGAGSAAFAFVLPVLKQ
jgi:hypothetical protein